MDLGIYKKEGKCPVCHSSAHVQEMTDRFAYWIKCSKCGEYALDNSVSGDDIATQCKLRSCLYYYLAQQKDGFKSKRLVPIFAKTVNENGSLEPLYKIFLKGISNDSIMQIYPRDIHEKIAMIMTNLSYETQYVGNNFSVRTAPGCSEDYHLFFLDESYGPESINKQLLGILKLLEEENLIEDDGSTFQNLVYRITPSGWELIDEYLKTHQSLAQGFIAMWFDPQMEPAKTTIMEGVNECGYMSLSIDLKEHNNQIVPEIFFEIRRSEFVVADLTGNRGGVYYEAGYAEGLGKQVILCCRADKFDELHFDVKQKSAIIWKDLPDLKNRLIKRIEATIGKRQPL